MASGSRGTQPVTKHQWFEGYNSQDTSDTHRIPWKRWRMEDPARDILHPLFTQAWSCLVPPKENTTLCQVLCHKHPWRRSCWPGTPRRIRPDPPSPQRGGCFGSPLRGCWLSRPSMLKMVKKGEVTECRRLDLRTKYRALPPQKTLYTVLMLSVNSFSVKLTSLLSRHHSRYKRGKNLVYWPKTEQDGETTNNAMVSPPWEMKRHLTHPTSLRSRKL